MTDIFHAVFKEPITYRLEKSEMILSNVYYKQDMIEFRIQNRLKTIKYLISLNIYKLKTPIV